MEEEKVPFTEDEKKKAVKAFEDAIKEDRIRFLEKDGHLIGFMTYVEKKDRVLIDYAFIYKKFRQAYNFLSLRRVFRDIFKTRFVWKSRRRKRLCSAI